MLHHEYLVGGMFLCLDRDHLWTAYLYTPVKKKFVDVINF
jgi:hypothetical protein